ncbi:efflux RND transporter periplasmic adaptor subunit, partial [bacterium]|nr:efflux RND transporter periplasmic adaptor subunit [bacterium]
MNSQPATHPRRRAGVLLLVIVALAAAGLGATGAWLAARRVPAPTTAASGQRWLCPMHPNIVRDHPDNCPACGMKLVPVKEESPAGEATAAAAEPEPAGLTEVDIDLARQQLIGLTTAAVDSGPIGGAWRTVGRVAVDERRVRAVNLKVGGFVERVFVDFTGQSVAKGDPLFALYSPELLAAQEEFLVALRGRQGLAAAGADTAALRSAERLLAAARRRLELWDVPAAAIDRLAATGRAERALTFVSPVAGVVTRKAIVEGATLAAGSEPYAITDLSAVWVLADAYASELGRVRPGLAATFTSAALPGREFAGRVSFVEPLLDAATRTLKLRLELPNPGGALRPELFGEVALAAAPRRVLRLPTDALLDAGGGEWVVFVARGEGRFAPRRVRVGERDADHAELLGGLAAGELVVTAANYLVDSESRLRAALAALTPAGGAAPHAE